jgi:hypothetical protein
LNTLRAIFPVAVITLDSERRFAVEEKRRGGTPALNLDEYPDRKLERGILHANRLLDERVLPGFLQDQLLLWTMEANSARKEKAMSRRASDEIREGRRSLTAKRGEG